MGVLPLLPHKKIPPTNVVHAVVAISGGCGAACLFSHSLTLLK